MMSYLVLDIETILDPSLPALPRKRNGDDAFGSPPYHQIVAMGFGYVDDQHQVRRIAASGATTVAAERRMLWWLTQMLETEPDATVITWGGRSFDLPVVAARCLKHGVSFPWYYQRRDPRYRHAAHGHLDLMHSIVDYGATRPYSLNVAARLIGMPGKMGVDGSNVQAMMDAGQLGRVMSYCMSDVVQTIALFLRTQLLRGVLDPERCATAMESLLTIIADEPRLAPMLPLIDRDRLVPLPIESPEGVE
jgi:predicted PolB exonuclease-like 3'-5' exonuclease